MNTRGQFNRLNGLTEGVESSDLSAVRFVNALNERLIGYVLRPAPGTGITRTTRRTMSSSGRESSGTMVLASGT